MGIEAREDGVMKFFSLGLILLIALIKPAAAENIVDCGDSEGRSLFAGTALLKDDPEADKWVDDRISGGKISLVKHPDGSLDILYSDVRKVPQSAKSFGAVVVEAGRSDRGISIIVSYPGRLVETYTFFIRKDGKHEVLWTATKYGIGIDSVRAMRARCSWTGTNPP